ncbi:DNA repair protein complementing XP-G cells homolog [Anoplophora glabripennis]|uniref:DNA repair protein complementing XP-G cells homolog n=1 Tax=Anoplophora glabripennis TaxID=217634 RepID=UPI000874FC0F|nr:DNA repair protein complementing XP-G cells homolog [Anoplophora glabripennis]
MGVHGLWRLIEPSGKPVPLETLENKVLAVDVSIWLHQVVKGFQDSKGAPVPNAHLLGIYHRVCKLLYFKIKPVFIFDGGVPVLKKQTIAKRNQQKSRNSSEAERLQKQLISTLLKHSAISKVISEKTKACLTLPLKKTTKHENMYALPAPELDSTISSSEEEDLENTDTTDSSPTKHWDIHNIDMSSTNFKSLPVDVRHEILTDLKETRKQNSWGRLHELPKQSDDFAVYQMSRLLKRQAVQSALEDAEKEMGGHSLSLAELESILKDHGVVTNTDIGKRIASDENTRYLYIKDIKQALEKARQEQLKLDSIQEEDSNENDTVIETKNKTKADLEFEEDLEKAIALSLQEEPSTSKTEVSSSSDNKNKPRFSFLENFNDADFESDVSDEVEEVPVKKKISSAQSYMMEYSGLTPNEINKILNDKKELNSSKGKTIVEKRFRNLAEIKLSNNNVDDSDRNNVEQCKISSNEQTSLESKDGKCENRNEVNSKEVSANVTRSELSDIKKISTDQNNFDDSNCIISSSDDINKITKATADKIDTIDLLSNGDTSSSDEFEEVSEEIVSKDKNSVEIVIDPNQKLEDDDLFSDIFDRNEEIKTSISEIVIQQQSEFDGNVISEVSETKRKVSCDIEKPETEISSSRNEDSNKNSVDVVSKISVPDTVEKIPDLENLSRETVNGTSEEKSSLHKSKELKVPNMKLDEMIKLKDNLQKEKLDILVEKSTKERMASNITDQMYQEAQDLLELFGVPYIVAPMEAEAQCAFLDTIELTDGTITDDSDIWLFGGRTVYKNFFSPSKYVMEFKAENIKHHFKLTREQMILLALLVGSDYTIGLQGVGPVTALEILAAFPPMQSQEFSLSHTELLSGLKEFRSWFNKGKSAGLGRSVLKNKLKNITFTDNFPSSQVVHAYLEPTVETSREKFSWSKPDFVGLTDFAKEKFGWSHKKTEEILKPVVKKVEENQAQKSIKDYFKTVYKADSTDAQNQMSKRVQSAIKRIGKTPEELIAEEMEALSKEKQKRSRNKRNNEKTINKEVEHKEKPKRTRRKKSENTRTINSKQTSGENVNSVGTETEEPDQKKSKSEKVIENDLEKIIVAPAETSQQTKEVDENSVDLKKYENIAIELKQRRQKRNEMSKKNDTWFKKKTKPPPTKTAPTEVIPQVLEEDEEIQLLKATTSRSLKRVEEIDREVRNEVEQVKKQCLPHVHKKEIIHQRLRDKSDSLKNKLKAMEVFRKSKKGLGYVPKRGKKITVPKEDAGLSEESSGD